MATGKRTAQEIRDHVSAEYGPVPLELVLEYLQSLEKIGVVKQERSNWGSESFRRLEPVILGTFHLEMKNHAAAQLEAILARGIDLRADVIGFSAERNQGLVAPVHAPTKLESHAVNV